VHQLVCADNGVNRTGEATMCATDTQCFVDNGNGWRDGLCERYDIPAEQVSQSPHRVLAARRAEINGSLTINNSRCEGPATRIATLCTLRLRKKIIDLLHEVAVA
jgi:hypothetical protein